MTTFDGFGKKLRPYQQEALDATFAKLGESDSTVVVLPTGCGKTVYAAKLITRWERGNCLFLAHTKELVSQAADKLGHELGYRPAVEMNVQSADPNTLWSGGMTVVGSVQTMCGDKRLEKYKRHPFGLIVIDECVTGDTLIDTDAGEMRIDALPASTARRVMTYDGEAVCYRSITAFMPKGVRPVLRIETASGRVIRCTGNHPLYTARGWVNASAVRKSDSLLRVFAGAASPQASTGGADRSNTSPVTSRSPSERGASGSECTRNCSRTRRSASAGVASAFNSAPDRSTVSSTCTWGIGVTPGSSTATISDPQSGRTNSRSKSVRPFSARCSVTVASVTRTRAAATPVCTSTTAGRSGCGRNTRPVFCPRCRRSSRSALVPDTERRRFPFTRGASPAYARCMNSFTETGGSDSVANGSTPSAKSGWRGGSATTAQRPAMASSSTPKATRRKMFGSLPNGSATPTGRRACIATASDTTSSRRSRPLDAPSFAQSSDTCPTACSTSFDPVVSIRSDGAEPVYDISVDGTHCFFGNGVLVHNCHHSVASTYRKVVDYFRETNPHVKVVGITATPNRSDKAALGLVFDSVAYQMSITDAVGEGWLVPISQEYVVVEELELGSVKSKRNEFGESDFNASQLEAILTQEDVLHKIAVPAVEKLGDRPTLVFTASVRHAHELAAVINRYKPGSAAAVDGGTDRETRVELVSDFAAGRRQFLCNCAVLCLDEETEILTDRGFVGIDGMTPEHKVANWGNGRAWFDHPKLIVRRDRERFEQMVTLDTPRRSIRVTEDHRMLFRASTDQPFRIENARNITAMRGNLPVSGMAEPFDVGPQQEARDVTAAQVRANAYHLRKAGFSPDEAKAEAARRAKQRAELRHAAPAELTSFECELIGFWLGDGSANYPRRGGVEYTLCQAAHCPNIVARIDSLLAACGLDYARRTRENAKTGGVYHVWSVPRGTGGGSQHRRGLYRLEPYLNKSGTPLIWGLNAEQFGWLLRGLWMADGTHNDDTTPPETIRVVGANRDLFDLLQAVAVCRGYRASLRTEQDPRAAHYHPLLTLSARKETDHRMTEHTLQFEEGWRPERVWCVTSHSGNIITRRRGSVTVMGNTEGFDAPNCAAVVMARPTKSLSLYTQMLGRGLRPLPGVVDGVPDAQDRRLAILTSEKPSCVVLDFVGNSKHKLASVYDVLGGEYDVAVRELAQQGAGDRKPVAERLAQAAALMALENQWKDREHIRAREIKYQSFAADPFAGDVEMHGSDYSGQKRGTATDSQVRLLVNLGVERRLAEMYSKRQAGVVIDRVGATKCTAKQAAALARNGINPDGIGFVRAGRILDALAANGWRKLTELPE